MYNYKIIHIVEEHLYSYCYIDLQINFIKEKYSVTDKDINSWIKSKGRISKSTEVLALKEIEMEKELENKIQWHYLIKRVIEYYEKNEPEKFLFIKLKYFEKSSTTKIEMRMALCRATQSRIRTDIVYYIAMFAVKEKLLNLGIV